MRLPSRLREQDTRVSASILPVFGGDGKRSAQLFSCFFRSFCYHEPMFTLPILFTLCCVSLACAEQLPTSATQNVPSQATQERICWHVLSAEQIRELLEQGVDPNSNVGEKGATLLATVLMQHPNPDLVELVLKMGASVTPSKRFRHYFRDYTFLIPKGLNMPAEDAAKIMRLLLDAGCSIDALNHRGESLRIYYGKFRTPASQAIGEVLRERGAKLHPDAR